MARRETIEFQLPAARPLKESDLVPEEESFPIRPALGAETVNHPRHYNVHPSGVECIDVVEHMSFNLGNAVKYIWRAGEKVGEDEKMRAVKELEDLRKARWYIDREIARLGAKDAT